MWHALRRLFVDPELQAARRAAVDLVAETMPDVEVVGRPSLRARERDRLVLAVFYRGQFPSRPTRYTLVEVDPDSCTPRLIDPPRDSAYWIRNYK